MSLTQLTHPRVSLMDVSVAGAALLSPGVGVGVAGGKRVAAAGKRGLSAYFVQLKTDR